MITKNDIVLAALEELRISGLTTSPTPSEISAAVRRLDNMMYGWQNKNLCISYSPSVSYSDIDPNQDSGLNNSDMFAVVANLAKNLCAMYGKICHPQTKLDAKDGYDNLFSVIPPSRESNPYLPLGTGNSFGSGLNYNYKFQTATNSSPDNCETFSLGLGDTDFFTVDFSNYLLDGATIVTATVEAGQGVDVLSNSFTDSVVSLECKGANAGSATVKITITTTTVGRVNVETVYFNIVEG